MLTKRFDPETEKAILSHVDKKFCDSVDRFAMDLSKTLHKDYDKLSAYEQRDCKYASIKALLPDIFLAADVESTEVTPERADDIIGRIYTDYIVIMMTDKGFVDQKDGKSVVSADVGKIIRLLLQGKIRLSDIDNLITI